MQTPQTSSPLHLSSANSHTLQGDGEVKKREDVRRKVTAANETLFVVNFDPDQCRERDLERHFGEYGRLRRVQVWPFLWWLYACAMYRCGS